MEIFILFVFLVTLSIILYVASNKAAIPSEVIRAEAGDTKYINTEKRNKTKKHKKLRKNDVFTYKGSTKRVGDFIQCIVDGDCMEPRKLVYGDLVLVEALNSDKLAQMSKGDILLIYLNDENYNGHKLRIFDKVDPEDNYAVKTHYFSKDGKEVDSSRSHKLKDVVGIVRYKYPHK